jgi:predicted small secreted protein
MNSKMKKRNFKSILAIAVLLAFTLSMTSCNRGYGCPNNFSLKSLTSVVSNILR